MDDINETFDKKLIGLSVDGANVNRGDKDGSYQHAQKEPSVCDLCLVWPTDWNLLSKV